MTGHYDLILRGGRVIDGSGSVASRADVAIQGECIAAIGRLDGARARREIDVSGMAVAPASLIPIPTTTPKSRCGPRCAPRSRRA